MKKVIFIIITLVGIGLIFSCAKQEQDPVLDMGQTVKPAITNPAGGSDFVLQKEQADSVLFDIIWSAASYNLNNLETVKYSLEIDQAANNFSNFSTLVSSTDRSYEMTVGALNNMMVTKWELEYGVSHDLSIRVRSFINTLSDYSYATSDVITFSVTPYDQAAAAKYIYLLGSATTVEWDNTIALQMAEIDKGKYAIVETLIPNEWIKFISALGQWAPQWGTDETGTLAEGPLVYRPTEDITDPPAIPSEDADGDYYIEADTVNLTYVTYKTTGELYLVGDACTVGWDPASGLQFTEGPDHVFTLETTLLASGYLKFMEVTDGWAPQWGTNAEGTGESGMISYRPTEAVEDPPGIPSPGADGTYVITVNMLTMQYSIVAK